MPAPPQPRPASHVLPGTGSAPSALGSHVSPNVSQQAQLTVAPTGAMPSSSFVPTVRSSLYMQPTHNPSSASAYQHTAATAALSSSAALGLGSQLLSRSNETLTAAPLVTSQASHWPPTLPFTNIKVSTRARLLTLDPVETEAHPRLRQMLVWGMSGVSQNTKLARAPQAHNEAAIQSLLAASEVTRGRFLDYQFLRNRRQRSETQMSRQWYVSLQDWTVGSTTAAEGVSVFDEVRTEHLGHGPHITHQGHAPHGSTSASLGYALPLSCCRSAPTHHHIHSRHPTSSQEDEAGPSLAPQQLVEEDPSQTECALSGERFEKIYDPDSDKWYYENAVVLSGEQAAKYGVMEGSIVKVHSLAGAPSQLTMATTGVESTRQQQGSGWLEADLMMAGRCLSSSGVL